MNNEKYLLSWDTEEEGLEKIKWMSEATKDVGQGELYMHLEEKLEELQHLKMWSYRIMSGQYQIGFLNAPGFTKGTESITAEEFRKRYHEIMQKLEDDEMVGYTITLDGEPAAVLLSNSLDYARMSAALEIFDNEVKRQERQASDSRSRFSRFLGRFGRGSSH